MHLRIAAVAAAALLGPRLSSAQDLAGVWDLYTSDDIRAIEAHQVTPSPDFPSIHIQFAQVEGDRYAGRYIHPTIPARAYPNCPYTSDFEARLLISADAGHPYPLVSILQSTPVSCDAPDVVSWEGWLGFLRSDYAPELGTTITGVLRDNNGNTGVFTLVYNPGLSTSTNQ